MFMNLSTRACNVLVGAFMRAVSEEDATEVVKGFSTRRRGTARMLVAQAMRLNFPAMEPGPLFEWRCLMISNKCGEKTAREICKALGFDMPRRKRHVCKCATCGRTL